MVEETNELGDSVVPIYEFEWGSSLTRTTETLVEQEPVAIENLAEVGRDDPECEVTLIGYQT